MTWGVVTLILGFDYKKLEDCYLGGSLLYTILKEGMELGSSITDRMLHTGQDIDIFVIHKNDPFGDLMTSGQIINIFKDHGWSVISETPVLCKLARKGLSAHVIWINCDNDPRKLIEQFDFVHVAGVMSFPGRGDKDAPRMAFNQMYKDCNEHKILTLVTPYKGRIASTIKRIGKFMNRGFEPNVLLWEELSDAVKSLKPKPTEEPEDDYDN